MPVSLANLRCAGEEVYHPQQSWSLEDQLKFSALLSNDSGHPFPWLSSKSSVSYLFCQVSSMGVSVEEIPVHETLTVVGHMMQLPQSYYYAWFHIFLSSLLNISIFINLDVEIWGNGEKMTRCRWICLVSVFCAFCQIVKRWFSHSCWF